jgi:hypothetical protein
MHDNELILHHYTSGTGVLGMFDSDSIWATQIHYLNDAKEFGHAIDQARSYLFSTSQKSSDALLKELCTGLSESLEQVSKLSLYVACFSGMEDSLSQWRGYCPPGFGYSVGFFANELRRIAQPQGFDLVQCIYDQVEKHRMVEAWAQSALQQLRASLPNQGNPISHSREFAHKSFASFAQFAPVLKDSAFRNEYEWRLVGLIPSTDQRIRLRPVRSMLAPYLPIQLNMKSNENLVWNVRVGPTPHKELASSALTHYFGKVTIRNGVGPSSVPYRDW